MKTVAAILALVLHLTGGWNHVSSEGRAQLSRAGVNLPAPLPSLAVAPDLVPVRTGGQPPAIAPNASVYAFDRATGIALFEQNSDVKRPIASVTKIITALVVLDRHQPTDLVTVGTLPAYDVAAETLGLKTGEVYTVGDLVTMALIPSANDAADALAMYDAGSVAAFSDRMNAKMATWGITDAHFSNPSGLIDIDNTVSAKALARIAQLVLAQPFITATIALPSASVTSSVGRSFTITTTNKLLASDNFYGIKTGYTEAAGECFIGLTKVNGHEIVTVLLGADDRFGETRTLVNWIGREWTWL